MVSTGTIQNLSDSRAQALQVLLDSISSERPSSDAEGREMMSAQVMKISDKFGDLLGDTGPGAEGGRRNEKGELVNEEGLPIIDIREPITDTLESTPLSDNLFDDPDLLPPWALSDAEKARRRAERERILDIFEEEERAQQVKDDAGERERFQLELEKRKEAAKAEMDSIRKARELQKKMGKALLRNVVETQEREEKERAAREQEEQEEREARHRLKPKKSVTFADLPESTKAAQKFEEKSAWSSVALGRPERNGKSPIMTKAEMGKQPMRMHVVERHPGKQATPFPDDHDSDDESTPGSPIPVDFDKGGLIHSHHFDEEADGGSPSSPSGSEEDADLDADDEPVVWDEEGFDFASHQREIALAYYAKRATIASDVASAMRAHTHDGGENEWDLPEVPLDASLAHKPPKPSTSKFKSEYLSHALRTSSVSHSLGSSVIPSSQSATLKSSIRMGKLENGKLVGADEGDSSDDVEAEAREVFEMLRKGQVTNAGSGGLDPPTFLPQDRQPRPLTTAAQSSISNSVDVAVPQKPTPSRVSKFKLALSGASGQPNGISLGSPLPTPVLNAARSSPKLASCSGTPILPRSFSLMQAPSVEDGQLVVSARLMPGMIVDSPSFAPHALQSGTPFVSAIIDSPSFVAPEGSDSVSDPTSFAPSPSSPPDGLSAPYPLTTTVAERQTGVMSVLPSSGSVSSRNDAQKTGRKVSRFLAERN